MLISPLKFRTVTTLTLVIALSTSLLNNASASPSANSLGDFQTSPTQQAEGTQDTKQSASICQTVDAFNDFDFWLGNWQVMDNSTNKFSGTNSVVKMVQNCMILENWVDASGSSGKSISYFNPMTGNWRQIWIGSSGYLIDIEGGLVGNDMVLEGTISTFGNHKQYPFKGTWTKLDRGKVQQVFHQFDPQKQTWVLWYSGTYTRTR